MDLLGLRHPIIQAPMAGASTPDLAGAVSNAGGMGSLGLARTSPPDIASALRQLRLLTSRPIAANLLSPLAIADEPGKRSAMQECLARYYRELGVECPAALMPPPFGFAEQLAAVLAERPAVVSFAFDLLSGEVVRRIKATGAVLIGTATTVDEAQALVASGCDAIVAQSAEAGGHRGTFKVPFDRGLIGLATLVPQIVDAVSVPVIAAGAIMDARGIVAALALGADGVQMGTAFLACPENTAVNPHYRAAILAAGRADTVLSRAYTGRPARMLRNRFTDELASADDAIPAYPVQAMLTQPLVQAATEQGAVDLIPMLVGQGVAQASDEPAGKLVERLAAESLALLDRLGRQLA